MKTIARLLLISSLVIGVNPALAEDIDIYSQNTAITPGAPNVLIILDNTANWSQSFASSTKFAAEKVALAQVINALKAQFNLGVMMYTETGGSNSNTDGGYVRFAIQAMTDANGNATNARNCLLTMIGGSPTPACSGTLSSYYTNLDINNDKSNGGKAGVTMGEAYDYFAGVNAYAGNNKVKADPLAFVSRSIAGPTYDAPGEDGTCQKNFIIVISNGPFQDNAADSTTAMSQLGTAGGETTVITPPDTVSNNNAGDEWTRFLNKSAVNVVTYTLEVGPSTTGQGPYNTQLLQSMGRQGKGGYYSAIDADTLNAALTRIFNDIQAVNSVFASSSLPLSADNTGNFANQVYMAVFRPDGSGLPRWLGNLKQYQFGVDSNGKLFLADANGVAAGSATSGFAQTSAQSFWTSKDTSTAPDAAYAAATSTANGSTGGFWYYDAKGDGGSYDLPDGEWVEKGGAAQQLRLSYLGYGGRAAIGDTNGTTARKVYTCTGSCLTTGTALSGTPFDSSNTALTSDPTQFGISPAAVTVSSISSDRVVATITSGGTALAIKNNGLVATATQVTVTTQANKHNLTAGSYVTIAGSSISGTNGTFQIASVPANNQFTYAVTGVTAGTSTGSPTATPAGTTATVSLSTPHGFSNGMAVKISQASCPPASAGAASIAACAFNGTGFTVANKTTNTFTITLPSPGVGASATGTPLASVMIARVTTTAAHGYSTGDSVTIANASCSPTACSEYNTTAPIFNLTPTTFDYLYSATSPLPVASNSGITSTNNTGASGALLTMLKWLRGQDTQNENGFQVAGANTDVRASIHGDILHSRPVVLNYAATGAATNNVYLFYGGNDGVFRAIKGGQAATDGREQWAFIAKEFFPILKRQYDDSPAVLYPTTPSGTGATRRNYAFDGPVVPYIERDSAGAISKVYLYISVRRGGRFIYALDVTSPTNPKFLWRKGCSTSGGVTTCDSGFSELGQTWSTPAVVKVQGHANPVLIFGGGYDAASEDPEPPSLTDTMGRIIYVLDAFDGSIVWSAGNSAASPTVSKSGMDFSIAADVLTVDRRQIGFVDRAYAADVGGNLWRIDLGGTDTSTWAIWKIASVGGRTASSAGRKFLFGPDVVLGDTGTFDAIVIGSGDREHPLQSNAAADVANRAYMFMDTNTGTTGADLNITENDLVGITVSSSSTPVDLTNKKGWYVTLRDGEQVVNGPIVVASQMVFGTNEPCTSGKIDPSTGDCVTSSGELSCTGNLGVARRYLINYLTAAPAGFTNSGNQSVRWELAVGGGFLPSPTAGVVEVNGNNYPFITDNPLNPGGVINPVINVSNKRFRTYWHEVLE